MDIFKYLELSDSVKGLSLYRFPYKPKSFLLTMVRKADCKCNRNMSKYECSNHVYIPALMPIFTSRQEKKMEKAMEERLFRQFQNMENPAINLFVDSPQ